MSVRRHQNIVDAIAGGDPGLARQVVERHMQEAMTNLSQGLMRNRGAASA
jgi:DNA-binding GntR family transcriptional regulator